ncbi:ABC transporter ATP-binding protein [Nocardia sp. NPDC006630]|uniref:ABC transporter ATP-binding protein n=1 Tax=Nocardia sp. NPDC006630 TaxID=3157181 RepID=UPI0033A0EF90
MRDTGTIASTTTGRGQHLRLLWSFVRPHRRRLLLALLLGFGYTAAALATPLATKWILDSVGAAGSLVQPIALLAALLVLGAGFGLAEWILLGRIAEHIVLDARAGLVRRFFRGVLPDLQFRPPGELVTRVTSDTLLLREAASSSLIHLINGTIALVGTLILMAVLDVPLLLCTLAAVLIIAVLAGWLMPAIAVAQRQAQESVGRLGGILEGGIRALRTVKSSGSEERETQRVLAEARTSARHAVRAVRIEAVAWTVAGSGIQLAIIVILAYGAWRVGQGELAVSTLVAFLLYAFQLADPVGEMTTQVAQLQSGVAAAARLREAESIRTEDLSAGSRDATDRTGRIVLTFEDVSVTYPGSSRPALRHLSAAVPRRGHTAVVGPSGAGKTTLFSLMLRFYDPDSGRIMLDDKDYGTLRIDGVRARIGYVEQETPLLAGTVRDNVIYQYPDATDAEAWAALAAVGLDDTVRRMSGGLDEPVAHTSLSGGQRQRIALARAIVRRPDVLLLDEATAQLDGRTEAAVQDIIRRIARDSAVVTIAHRLSTVIDADTIWLMEDGALRAVGTHEELLAGDELYRELVAALRISGPASHGTTGSASALNA